MREYLDLLENVLANGEERADRTHTGTLSLFGERLVVPNVSTQFPLLTTKRIYWHGVVTELLWFLRGDTNVKYLQDHNVYIWDEWADENGDLGPTYGFQWSMQLFSLVEGLRHDPWSRRHMLTAWSVRDLPHMRLPPCHVLSQFYVSTDWKLDCHVYQRSADVFLGVPFNIASYALLMRMLAQVTGTEARRLTFSYGDLHLYQNHVKQAQEQLKREPKTAPVLTLNLSCGQLYDFAHEDITLTHYHPWPSIKAEVAV